MLKHMYNSFPMSLSLLTCEICRMCWVIRFEMFSIDINFLHCRMWIISESSARQHKPCEVCESHWFQVILLSSEEVDNMRFVQLWHHQACSQTVYIWYPNERIQKTFFFQGFVENFQEPDLWDCFVYSQGAATTLAFSVLF